MKKFLIFYILCACLYISISHTMETAEEKAEQHVKHLMQLVDDFVQQNSENQSPRIKDAIHSAQSAIKKCTDQDRKSALERTLSDALNIYELNKNIARITKSNSSKNIHNKNGSCCNLF